MDRYESGGSINESSKLQDRQTSAAAPEAGGAVFDSKQYEFFGNAAMEEVELGGLEDEENDVAPLGFEEEQFQLEDAQLNKVVSGPTNAGFSGDWGSRESSSVAEWAQEADAANWFDQHSFNAKTTHEREKWSPQPYPGFMESKSLHRASSYPEQQQQQPYELQKLHNQYSSEPILNSKSPPFTSYPPPGSGISQHASPSGQSSHPNISHHHGAHQMSYSSSNHSAFSNTQLQMNTLPRGSQFGGNSPQFPHGLPVNGGLQNQWASQNSMYPGDRSGLNQQLLQQLPHQNGLVPPPSIPIHHKSGMQQLFPPSFGHLSGMQSQPLNPHLPPSQLMLNNFDVSPDLRDQRAMSMMRNRQGLRYPHQGSDLGWQKSDEAWPRFASKYMSAAEIDNIVRVQLAATHSNNPYVDDYYHQACLSKKSAGGAKLRHHFCPVNLVDGSSRARASSEPHAFLQVDALGRVAFSSVRRPRPLLEVDTPKFSGGVGVESKVGEKPLEEEPMLAARVIIEECMNILLDVDDIDRFLQFNQLPDGGAQLRQRRQVLLEGLASSLHLVDPLENSGHMADLASRDDLVFLRLVSLSKGRKLLLRYLQLLFPGELVRVVCMAIFRNLRFFFGNYSVDPTTENLVKATSSCVHSMELKALAACLALVVCSAEPPPLRPVGSAAGDGASVILKSVLERATELLTDPQASVNCSIPSRSFWQASFDAFFGLLTKYCFNKYDSIVQSFFRHGSPNTIAVGSDVAKAISREMPVELLRTSLPHTSEQQRKLLLEFARRTMPVPDASS